MLLGHAAPSLAVLHLLLLAWLLVPQSSICWLRLRSGDQSWPCFFLDVLSKCHHLLQCQYLHFDTACIAHGHRLGNQTHLEQYSHDSLPPFLLWSLLNWNHHLCQHADIIIRALHQLFGTGPWPSLSWVSRKLPQVQLNASLDIIHSSFTHIRSSRAWFGQSSCVEQPFQHRTYFHDRKHFTLRFDRLQSCLALLHHLRNEVWASNRLKLVVLDLLRFTLFLHRTLHL